MTERLSTSADAAGLDAAIPEIRRQRRISPIWALPIVALFVAAWLGYTAFAESGPTISISFRTASGIEPGKTRIKYHDIVLGVVEHVTPSDDLSHVKLAAKMTKMAARHLKAGTKFWVVRPRIGLSGFSGLDTLVSGAYIEMDPGDGKLAHSFDGLEDPPVIRSNTPGREFVLSASKLGSISAGSPVFFHGMQVGEVTSQTFSQAGTNFQITIFVREPFDAFVYDGTRFWNASGITLATGAGGFKVEVESLQALVAGGIAFDTEERARRGTPSGDGAAFQLFEDETTARDAAYTQRTRAIVEFSGSVRGLEKGSPVEFRGLRIGQVLDLHLEFDPATGSLFVPVMVEFELERARFTSGSASQYGQGKLLPAFVQHGMRAQLRSASLITGQMMVAFDFFPDAPPESITYVGEIPKLPTVATALDSIERSVSQTLDRVAALPLDKLVQDVRNVLVSVHALTSSPEVKELITSLNKTLASTDSLMQNANSQVGPLLVSLRRTSDATDAMIKQANGLIVSANAGYGGDSRMRADVSELLRQLQETAKSVRNLASYLEQHPELLLRGKSAR